jgi:hypothetical protein
MNSGFPPIDYPAKAGQSNEPSSCRCFIASCRVVASNGLDTFALVLARLDQRYRPRGKSMASTQSYSRPTPRPAPQPRTASTGSWS